MLPENASPTGEYRHDYLRLVFLIGAVLLFAGHATVNQLSDRGNNRKIFRAFLSTCTFDQKHDLRSDFFPNSTLRVEDMVINDILPSDWVYRSLDAFNYLWQVESDRRRVS